VYRFTEGNLKDVTPKFCSEIENEKHFPRPTGASLEHFKNSKIASGSFENLDDEGTAGKVMSLAIHYVFCRRFDKALDVIHQMWPKEDQANLIENIRKAISLSGVCLDCTKEMEKWH
jgi:hypothetical protein